MTEKTAADRRTDLLRKVRGLIDSADSFESKGQSEVAQSYRNKADNLMTMYAIEEFELAFNKNHDKEAPQVIQYDYGDLPKEGGDELVRLFHALATHCRCKVGIYGWQFSKIVGYPADLEYLDVMFTSLRMHLSANVRPQPTRDMGYEASLALLKESGMKWKDVYLRLLPIFPERFVGTVADVSKKPSDYGRKVTVGDHEFWEEIPRPIGVRFTKEYTTFCEEQGRERVYADPKVWVRSFVEAYGYEIRRRIREMSTATSEATASSGKELVLKSIMDDLLEFFYQNFPDKRPHAADCDCEGCHSCSDPRCKRSNCKARRAPVRYRSVPERATSAAASQRGRAAAATADLSGRGRSVGPNKTKEIG